MHVFEMFFSIHVSKATIQVKPCHSSRGRGIKVHDELDAIFRHVNDIQKHQEDRDKPKTVLIQRYIEKPLIIHNRKFDIRQWFLVTSFKNPKCYVYDNCYVRFSGEDFDLANLDDFVHLTNHSIQVTKVKKNKCTYESLMEDQSHEANMNFFNKCDPKYNSLPANRRKFVKLEEWEYVPSYNMWSCENLQKWLTQQGKLSE